MVGHPLDLKVDPLARITLKLVAMGALDSGSSLLTQLAPDLIGINLGTGIGSSHHPGSEVVGGDILNPLQWNLTRRLALETHDGPAAAARGCYVPTIEKRSVLLLLFLHLNRNGGITAGVSLLVVVIPERFCSVRLETLKTGRVETRQRLDGLPHLPTAHTARHY